MSVAKLSHKNNLTVFKVDDILIRFKAPYSLEKYLSIKTWDNGYIEVMTKYAHNIEVIEEYIDLIPILEDLNFDLDDFLRNIDSVEVDYE